MTKRVRLATFAISIVDNLCLLQRNKWNTIKIRSLVIINEPSRIKINLGTISDSLSVAEKTGRCLEVNILAVGDAV